MRSNVIRVNVGLDQEEVARVVSKYDLLAVPVVDDQGRLLGIVKVCTKVCQLCRIANGILFDASM
jgi:Mg/Co/Ni transporter MgtE